MMERKKTAPTRLRRVPAGRDTAPLGFHSPEYLELIDELLRRSAMVRNGEITGMAIVSLMSDGTTHETLLGTARSDIYRAIHGVNRLQYYLAWPEKFNYRKCEV